MICKYGKSVEVLKKNKQNYFSDNEALLKRYDEYAELYKKQPLRKYCKMCQEPLHNGVSFMSHGIEYMVCKKCGHVCGIYEETEEYSRHLYVDSDYNSYMYIANEEDKEIYDKRVKDFYLPKAEFLKDVLQNEEIHNEIEILDIGCGSGYFVSACDDLKMKSKGIDISKKQIEFGNKYLHNKNTNGKLIDIDSDNLNGYIRETTANVISAMGVIEHLLDFHNIFETICRNKNISYIYMSVPTFGLSNILEIISPKVFNRHLGGGIRMCFQ